MSIYFYHDFIVFIIIMVVVVVHSYILSCHVSSVQQRRTEATQNFLFATTWHSKNKTNNRLSCALTQKWMHVGLYCYCWLLLLLLGQEAHDTTYLTRVVITFYFYYVHRVSVCVYVSKGVIILPRRQSSDIAVVSYTHTHTGTWHKTNEAENYMWCNSILWASHPWRTKQTFPF